jgi:formamidopyrimidine-DNA glycosylase
MPELPDVEAFGRRLNAGALRRTIQRVVVNDARILGGVSAAAFVRRLKGARLLSSRRHGKHLLVKLDRGGWLTLHFGMTGGLTPFKGGDGEPPFTRVRFDFARGRSFAYTNRRMIGRVGLTDDAGSFIAAENLGPDALDPKFTLAAFREALAGSRRTIKTVLMDQAAMAGVGNIYSDEILFQSGVHPETAVSRLDDRHITRVFRTLKRVLRTAVAVGAGSEERFDRLPRGFLLPHRRKGGRCPRCRRPLRVFKAAGRTSYACTACQSRR